MPIDVDQPIADLVVAHPQLLTPLMRMGVKPALGNQTLRQAFEGSSLGLGLCTELLELTINPNYTPQSQVRYSLLPLSEYYSKAVADLRPWLKIMEQHLLFLGKGADETNCQPVQSVFVNFMKATSQQIDNLQKNITPTLQRLYEISYSPILDAEGEKVLENAIEITGKEQGDLSSDEIEDILSLLLRHTQVNVNDIAFCGAIQQLCNLKYAIDSIRNIRVKLLHPMVTELVRNIRRRNNKKPTL